MFALRGAFSRFMAADGLFLGAGLAFFVIVTVIPLVLLSVSTLGFILTSEQASNEVIGQLTRNFPVYRREVTAALTRIVDTRALTGVLGTLILVLFSTPLMSGSRLVLHRLLAIRSTTGYVRNMLTDSMMVLMIGGLLFLATIATWFYHWFELLVIAPSSMSTRWINAANVAFSIGISVGIFYLWYRYVPRRRVPGGAAFAGAIVAAVLWEIAKQLFGLYIRKVGVYDQIYGPLGVLVAFVMFVYYSAVVFVFGGAYVAALDARRR